VALDTGQPEPVHPDHRARQHPGEGTRGSEGDDMTEHLAAPLLTQPALPSRARRFGEWLTTYATIIALVAVGLSFVIGVGYSIKLGGALRFYDEHVYAGIVQSLAHGHGFSLDGSQPTAYRPPGYLFLLLPFYSATSGSVFAMRMVGVLALTGSVWFTYLLGKRVHTAGTGALAALVVACYPLLIFTATTLYPQVPALFLLLVTIELAMRALPEQGASRIRWAVGAGLVDGLLILTVPTFGVTAVGMIAWLAWRQHASSKRVSWRTVVVLLVATAVLPAAWCARNAASMHAFVPVSTNDGINLLLGNSPGTTADSGTSVDISPYTKVATDRHYGETELDHYYTSEAVHWIKDNPGSAAVLYAEKVANNFTFADDLATSSQGSTAQNLVSAVSYYPILLLAVLRLLLYRRWPLRPTEKLITWTIVINVLLLAVFFTRLRFRVPLDGLTIVLAASTVTNFLATRRGRREGVA
jgi:4-amino-4-deoxy-L-arabinose transferase-like glycosyltransferase